MSKEMFGLKAAHTTEEAPNIDLTTYEQRDTSIQLHDYAAMSHDWERFFTHYFVATKIEESKATVVLDLMSGKGVFARALQRWAPSVKRYIMIDIDDKKLQAEGWGMNKHYNSWHFIIEKMNSPAHLLETTEHFKVVTCLFAIEHVKSSLAIQTLQKARSLLDPDGLFFITFPNNTAHPSIPKAHLQKYEYAEIGPLLTENGFFIQQTIGLYGKPSQIPFDNPLIPSEVISCLGYFYRPSLAAEVLFICKKAHEWRIPE